MGEFLGMCPSLLGKASCRACRHSAVSESTVAVVGVFLSVSQLPDSNHTGMALVLAQHDTFHWDYTRLTAVVVVGLTVCCWLSAPHSNAPLIYTTSSYGPWGKNYYWPTIDLVPAGVCCSLKCSLNNPAGYSTRSKHVQSCDSSYS